MKELRAIVNRALLLPAVAMLVSGSLSAQQSNRPTLDGNWTLWRRQPHGIDTPLRVELQTRGDSLTVTAPNQLRLQGRSTSSGITLSGMGADQTGEYAMTISASWSGDSLVGRGIQGPDTIRVLWMVRDSERRSSTPTRQTVHPAEFFRVVSATPRPLAHLWSGDTVRTETIGADGIDSAGKRRSEGGNPLTGPFYIENSLPGDVLVIRLLRVRTNRSWAVSGATIAPDALEPGYGSSGGNGGGDGPATWTIDAAAGIVRLKTPSAKLTHYTVPLHPILGSIAVAPGSIGRAEVRSTGVPGSFGGNMDYNRLGEGTTIYLPISQPGAYLYLGDGHAAQGDGELTGDALETSMDVEFSVELIRRKRIGMPRAEDAAFLMASGMGGSLDQAFRSATTRLATWLEQDYKLTRSEVALLMGTGVQYDIAEVVDGVLHVVARFPKQLLKGITP
ncbi:MAG: acetamidase/formamidase family protein [Gemmatimonadota bacterium]